MIDLKKYSALQKIEMLSKSPLANAPSTAGNSLFAKTGDLQTTIAKIRAIESNSPSLKKYSAPKMPTGNLCNKKDLEQAQRHLTSITATAPRKPFSALTRPAAAKAVEPAPKTISREAFNALNLRAKNSLMRLGYKITN